MSKENSEVMEALKKFSEFKYDFGVWNGVNKMKKDFQSLSTKIEQALQKDQAQEQELAEIKGKVKRYIEILYCNYEDVEITQEFHLIQEELKSLCEVKDNE